MRDAKAMQLPVDTSQMQRLIMAQWLLHERVTA